MHAYTRTQLHAIILYLYNLYIIIKYFSQYSFRVKFLLLTGLQKYSLKKGCFEMQNLHTRKGTSNADYYIRLLMISSLYV